MALNPFFLQGSASEQRLVQDLINEQLQIYGVEVAYIPRKLIKRQSIIKEIQSSQFDDNFLIEAYVDTYEGYSGQGDIMTKFGVSLKDEVSLTISKERYEDFISPFLDAIQDGNPGIFEVVTRPAEGDLVYFPLGQRLFEVKFVEHEKPFYQLQKNYVYTLQCELFEYEDEVIDTSIDAIDEQVQDVGYITTLNLIGLGRTATANAFVGQGFINNIFLNNDGFGYTSAPTVAISTAPSGGTDATAIATIVQKAGVYSVDEILLTNTGVGYTQAPTISISGGGGTGAAATCSLGIGTGITRFLITDNGAGYAGTSYAVTIPGPLGVGVTATAVAVINNDLEVDSIRITNPGTGYSAIPPTDIVIDDPAIFTGYGNYDLGELIRGRTSQCEARVKHWDATTNVLKVSNVGIGSTVSGFLPGEIIVGTASTVSAAVTEGGYAIYSLKSYDDRDIYDKYDTNDEIESEADSIVDFSQGNPFGTY